MLLSLMTSIWSAMEKVTSLGKSVLQEEHLIIMCHYPNLGIVISFTYSVRAMKTSSRKTMLEVEIEMDIFITIYCLQIWTIMNKDFSSYFGSLILQKNSDYFSK